MRATVRAAAGPDRFRRAAAAPPLAQGRRAMTWGAVCLLALAAFRLMRPRELAGDRRARG